MRAHALLLGVIALTAAASCFGQTNAPREAPAVTLTVQLPEPTQKLLYVHEVIPAQPGPLTLHYPKWIPGDHSPDGPINEVMGLEITANGQYLAWQRDELDRYTFHLTVPPAASGVDIRFEFPSSDRVTPNLLDLTWDHVALYRAGLPTRQQMFQANLEIPANWQYGTALDTVTHSDGHIAFKPVPFNTLVDSPVIAGRYFRQLDLTPRGSAVHRYLDMVGDSADAVAISATQSAAFRRLIEQAQALFRSHHYDSYHLLLTLSDHTSVGGLEHHQSSDDRARGGSKMFADPAHFMLDASLLPHEYTHSWNGKFMRPAGLWRADFQQPEKPKMLWSYEGLTVYLGDVLTARSGLWSADTWRDVVAYRAAVMDHRTGRAWRPLTDTTIAVDYSAPQAWANWRRQNDFYREGQLLWLAVDMRIRSLSHGQRTIDDLARSFFGVDDGSFVTHTYTFDDLVSALGKVQPYDWAGFLHTWVDGTGAQVPLLSGIAASGWKLVYTNEPSAYERALEDTGNGELEGSSINEMFSLGLSLTRAGIVRDVLWQGPAFKAGLAPQMHLLAVNDQAYSTKALRQAIAQAQQGKAPLRIRAEADGVTRVYSVDYHGGLRYPHLVRVPGTPDYLRPLLTAQPVASGS